MYQTILLSVDLGDPSSWERAAPTAVALGKQFGAKIEVVTVIPDFGMPLVANHFPQDFADKAKAASDAELKKLCEQQIPADLLAGSRVVHGTIYKEVIAAADDCGCDVIVMASHRPEMSDYLLGPNAARVARHAKQSVMIVRN